jgi:hypothetical protein
MCGVEKVTFSLDPVKESDGCDSTLRGLLTVSFRFESRRELRSSPPLSSHVRFGPRQVDDPTQNPGRLIFILERRGKGIL